MKDPNTVGMNRTGIDASPIDSKETIAEARRVPPTSPGDATAIHAERRLFIEMAGTVGTVPPPGTLRGMASTGMQKLARRQPETFINKLGERLAFERAGTRLYEALIGKCEALAQEPAAAEVPMSELRGIRDAEHSHFMMVAEAMRSIGADPTALTPDADANGVASLGLFQALTDPRTSVAQCVHAILVAELTDRDGWEVLVRMAKEMKHGEMAERFQSALLEEEKHVSIIRALHARLVLAELRGGSAEAA